MLVFAEAEYKFSPSPERAGYLEVLKDVKKKLMPIVKEWEMKGYKTSTPSKKSTVPKLNFRKML